MRIYGLLNVRLEHGNRPVMTALRDLAAPVCPSFVKKALPKMRGRRECRARRAHPQPRVRKTRSTRVSPPQVRRTSRHSLRNGFNGFLRGLPGEPGFLATVAPEKRWLLKSLIPASGYQDAATSPSAKRALVSRALPVHRIPHPTFVTIAIRPSYRARDARKMPLICPTTQAKGLRHFNATGKSLG
jgi:hypothetical protein